MAGQDPAEGRHVWRSVRHALPMIFVFAYCGGFLVAIVFVLGYAIWEGAWLGLAFIAVVGLVIAGLVALTKRAYDKEPEDRDVIDHIAIQLYED